VTTPKIELHVHLEGTVRPATLLEIARRNDYPLPAETEEGLAELYDFRDFAHFIEVWILTTNALQTAEDFRQVVVDYAAEAALHGAVYLSDEFAVLDEDGLVHPFPRPLSLRIGDARVPCDPIDLGAQTATGPMPVYAVVFTRFEPEGEFHPSPITPGRAIMEVLNNVVAVRANPRKSLCTARSATSKSIVLESTRGEASQAAALLLQLAGQASNQIM